MAALSQRCGAPWYNNLNAIVNLVSPILEKVVENLISSDSDQDHADIAAITWKIRHLIRIYVRKKNWLTSNSICYLISMLSTILSFGKDCQLVPMLTYYFSWHQESER